MSSDGDSLEAQTEKTSSCQRGRVTSSHRRPAAERAAAISAAARARRSRLSRSLSMAYPSPISHDRAAEVSSPARVPARGRATTFGLGGLFLLLVVAVY